MANRLAAYNNADIMSLIQDWVLPQLPYTSSLEELHEQYIAALVGKELTSAKVPFGELTLTLIEFGKCLFKLGIINTNGAGVAPRYNQLPTWRPPRDAVMRWRP